MDDGVDTFEIVGVEQATSGVPGDLVRILRCSPDESLDLAAAAGEVGAEGPADQATRASDGDGEGLGVPGRHRTLATGWSHEGGLLHGPGRQSVGCAWWMAGGSIAIR